MHIVIARRADTGQIIVSDPFHSDTAAVKYMESLGASSKYSSWYIITLSDPDPVIARQVVQRLALAHV